MKSSIQTLFILCMPLIVLGCAHQPEQAWYKPNPKDGEFERVRYTCLQESQQPYARANKNSGASGMGTNDNLYEACMNSKGWTLRQVPSSKLPTNSGNQTSSTPKLAGELPQCTGASPRAWDGCFGTYTYPNGNQYTGEFKQGLRDGKGTIRIVAKGQSSDKRIASEVPSTYTGDFKDDKISGYGTWVFDDGKRIEGKFSNNLPLPKGSK